MSFTPAFIDEIRSRVSVSSVVADHLPLVRKGREFHGLCPFHSEKTPSFTVNDEKQFFHCFGCGAHGDIIAFTQRIGNLTFPDAVEQLAAKAGLPLPETARGTRDDALKAHYDAIEAASNWFEAQLHGPAGTAGLAYLKGRGLSEATIRHFRLGFALDTRGALKHHLLRRGFAERVLEETSLIACNDRTPSFDFFRGRVMFPIRDTKGRVIAFGGRVLGDGQPKYLNSRDTPLFDKSRTLYAFDAARTACRGGAVPVVAEGYMDVIALHQAGFRGAVAPLGTALTEAQLELLWSLGAEPILCLDGDAAGRRAAERAAQRAMPLLAPGRSLRFAALPGGLDPDDLIRQQGADGFAACLAAAQPLCEVVWRSEASQHALDTPERRAALIDRLSRRIRAIGDRRVREQYVQMLLRERLPPAMATEGDAAAVRRALRRREARAGLALTATGRG